LLRPGLRAEYFAEPGQNNLTTTTVDASFSPSVFSASLRWTGKLSVDITGWYTVAFSPAESSIRLWVNRRAISVGPTSWVYLSSSLPADLTVEASTLFSAAELRLRGPNSYAVRRPPSRWVELADDGPCAGTGCRLARTACARDGPLRMHAGVSGRRQLPQRRVRVPRDSQRSILSGAALPERRVPARRVRAHGTVLWTVRARWAAARHRNRVTRTCHSLT
jgi:hypothetical protein